MAGLTRKELLAGAAAAGVVAGCGGSPKTTVDPRDWASVKAQYPLAPGVRYFDAFVLAPHPRPVRDAIERHRRGLDADPNGYLARHEADLEARVAEAAADYLQVIAGDIALTDSTTMGLGLVYGGPRGTGLVWTIKSWDALRPMIPSFAPSSYVAWLEGREPPVDAPEGPVFTPGGFHSFEHRWALAEAFEWQAQLGRTRVAERIRSLATRLKQGLEEIRGVKLVTPMAERISAGIVCFDIDGLEAGQAVDRLRREHRIAASGTPYAERHVRFGTGLWADEADVDAALSAIARL